MKNLIFIFGLLFLLSSCSAQSQDTRQYNSVIFASDLSNRIFPKYSLVKFSDADVVKIFMSNYLTSFKTKYQYYYRGLEKEMISEVEINKNDPCFFNNNVTIGNFDFIKIKDEQPDHYYNITFPTKVDAFVKNYQKEINCALQRQPVGADIVSFFENNYSTLNTPDRVTTLVLFTDGYIEKYKSGNLLGQTKIGELKTELKNHNILTAEQIKQYIMDKNIIPVYTDQKPFSGIKVLIVGIISRDQTGSGANSNIHDNQIIQAAWTKFFYNLGVKNIKFVEYTRNMDAQNVALAIKKFIVTGDTK
ncbi:MAG: hypothetical protein QM528_06410 [Phycisphaerales bacterium]|nr:hypothetical protein [Phycisphaerales bacterium]